MRKTIEISKSKIKLHYTLYLIFLLSGIFTACNSEKGDYKSPFYKMYKAETERGVYTLQVFRETTGDTLTVYHGYIVHPTEFNMQPIAFSGKAYKNGKSIKFQLTATEWLRAEISPYGEEINGWVSNFDESNNIYLPDSIPFAARLHQPKIIFKYWVEEGVGKSFPDIENSSELYYKYGLLEPVNLNLKDTDTLVYNQIKSELFKIYNLPDTTKNIIQTYVKKEIDGYFAYERENMKSENFNNLSHYKSSSSINRNVFVMNNSAGILTLQLSEHSYGSGAAHSIYGESYLSYNLKTGRKIALSNVLNPGGYKVISKLITNKIKENHKLKPNQSLKDAGYFTNSVKYTDKFFLTDYGVGFHYNIYEIAPFSHGDTTVFLTFEELEGYIQPEILALAELETIKN